MFERVLEIAAKVNRVSRDEVLKSGSNEAKTMLCYCLYTVFRMEQSEIADCLKINGHSTISKMISASEFNSKQYRDYRRKLSDVIMLASREREQDVYDRLMKIEGMMYLRARKKKVVNIDDKQLTIWS
jgi:hypothetical protein